PGVSCVLDHLFEGDPAGADALYREFAARSSPAELVIRLFEPAFVEVGERWFRGDGDIFQERCATAFLARKLGTLIDEAQRANPSPHHLILTGTVQGDRHEGGTLMLTLLLERAGWRALNLGVDLPVREYQRAVEAWHPAALALSFVMSRNINKRFRELERIE